MNYEHEIFDYALKSVVVTVDKKIDELIQSGYTKQEAVCTAYTIFANLVRPKAEQTENEKMADWYWQFYLTLTGRSDNDKH